jgi:hypothetical protein
MAEKVRRHRFSSCAIATRIDIMNEEEKRLSVIGRRGRSAPRLTLSSTRDCCPIEVWFLL